MAISYTMSTEASLPPVQRLDPEQGSTVAASLFVLVLLGLTLVALIWFGARWTRRVMQTRPRRQPSEMLGPSDWDPQPWVPPESDQTSGNSDEA